MVLVSQVTEYFHTFGATGRCVRVYRASGGEGWDGKPTKGPEKMKFLNGCPRDQPMERDKEQELLKGKPEAAFNWTCGPLLCANGRSWGPPGARVKRFGASCLSVAESRRLVL